MNAIYKVSINTLRMHGNGPEPGDARVLHFKSKRQAEKYLTDYGFEYAHGTWASKYTSKGDEIDILFDAIYRDFAKIDMIEFN